MIFRKLLRGLSGECMRGEHGNCNGRHCGCLCHG